MILTATQEACTLLGGSAFPRLESPSLRLEKFVRFRKDGKRDEIDAVVGIASRHQAADKAFRYSSLPGASTMLLKLQSRLIVNQAGGILENAGLCLHRHFGFPYIPGSAVKGIARHYAWTLWKQAMEDRDLTAAREFALKTALTFGFPANDSANDRSTERMDDFLVGQFPDLFAGKARLASFAGSVTFFAAQPCGKAPLVTDIVTCHHANYYRLGKEKATDDESPNPQFFPAVEAGATFEFVVAPAGLDRRCNLQLPEMAGFSPLEFARHCLRNGLEFCGVGAKTAAGYGWFEDDQDAARKLAEQQRVREEAEAAARRAVAEKARLEQMSPEDRDVEALGKQTRDSFIQVIKELESCDDSRARIILRALLEKHTELWLDDKTAKPKKKGGQRAELVRQAAKRIGITLP